MQEAKKVFEDYLSKYNLRMTNQRQSLFNLFFNTKGHISADEFFIAAKKLDSTLGVATIYRFLKLLREAGLADEIIFGEGKVRYEKKFGVEHHDHLICEQCGNNVEFYNNDIEQLQEEIANSNGYKLIRHKMYLFGLCSNCQK